MALDRIARKTLGSITTSDAADYRDRRLALVSVDTVRRDLGTLQHVWDVAERSWGLVGAENPFRLILKPKPGPGRTRRLSEDEELRLEVACNACRNKAIPLVVTFALETAMRQGEIVGLQKSDIDYEKRLALVRISKNGRSRLVPLSGRALEVARCGADLSDDTRVFATTTTGVKMAWKRILRRSAIEDVHFHDLRHEAISRLFERGFSLPEVALVSALG
ncbi:site-specific integrase [Nisaea sp.]|uniref:site-specific integrase n=1 Tax=Nisaea sp. TaxID=2024842 RepID=UPI0032ECF432